MRRSTRHCARTQQRPNATARRVPRGLSGASEEVKRLFVAPFALGRGLGALSRGPVGTSRSRASFVSAGGCVVQPLGRWAVLKPSGVRRDHVVAEAEITEAGQRIPVTVSIGGSGLPDKNASNPQDLILVADAAMLTSKESGRDRCAYA